MASAMPIQRVWGWAEICRAKPFYFRWFGESRKEERGGTGVAQRLTRKRKSMNRDS